MATIVALDIVRSKHSLALEHLALAIAAKKMVVHDHENAEKV